MAKQKKEQTKRLTLTEQAKLDKELSSRKEVTLLGKYKESIDIVFRKSKLDLLLANYLDILRQLNEREDVQVETLYRSAVLLNTLTIKYFSTVEIPSLDQLDDLVRVSVILVDIGLVDELFSGGENSFPESEIKKVQNAIEKASEKLGERFGELAVKSALNETAKESDGNAGI